MDNKAETPPSPIPTHLTPNSIFRVEIGKVYGPVERSRETFLEMPPVILKRLHDLVEAGDLKISLREASERKDSCKSVESGIGSCNESGEEVDLQPVDLEQIHLPMRPMHRNAHATNQYARPRLSWMQTLWSNKKSLGVFLPVLFLLGVLLAWGTVVSINCSSPTDQNIVACADGELDCYSLSYTMQQLQQHNIYSFSAKGCFISDNRLQYDVKDGACTGMDQLRRATVDGILNIFDDPMFCMPLTIYSGSQINQNDEHKTKFSARNGWRVKLYYLGNSDTCLSANIFGKKFQPMAGLDMTFCSDEGTVARLLHNESRADPSINRYVLIFGTNCDMDKVVDFNDDPGYCRLNRYCDDNNGWDLLALTNISSSSNVL